MATYKMRGTSHNVIYPYRMENGETKQQWESYGTELEALQRKSYIDYLQKAKRHDDVRDAAREYKRMRAIEKADQARTADGRTAATESIEDNTYRTYQEFIDKFLPFYARKKLFSPNTYDSYESNLRNHILPYFGKRVMSTITAEDIDDFMNHLSQKPCKGSKSYSKKPGNAPRLSSSTIKKCYTVLMVGFPTAKKWHYIKEIPDASAPAEKYKKRKAWEPEQVQKLLDSITDPVLHLAVHLAFVCSLRAGEVVGIGISSINLNEKSFWVNQIVQRVSDKAISTIPKEKIIRVFPKKVPSSTSSLILKDPKTEGSTRKQYFGTPLLLEIKERLQEIANNKAFLGSEYHDYGLLLCNADGTPIEPKSLDKPFKAAQESMGIEDRIEFQGLRKSGEMHKIRLTNNDYQLVASNGAHSIQVLTKHYNEVRDREKIELARLVEQSFYGSGSSAALDHDESIFSHDDIMGRMKRDPEFFIKVLQLMQNGA